MAEHTKGKLIFDDNEDVIRDESKESIGRIWTSANARRLVAAWNACQKLTTEELERGVIVKAAIESPEVCDIVVA